jgi:predicted aldo/keto reductase-like oxidoreductase
MIHRPIGRTGMQASVVGLGAEHLDNRPYEACEEVIDAALESGMDIMDVFMPGTAVRENIGRALKGRREQVLIQGHVGSTDVREQYDRTRDVPTCRSFFENLLRSLRTDYIDLGMMFFIDTEEDYRGVFETGYIDYVRDLKRAGAIRAVGFSSHDPRMAARVVETGEVELLMFSLNPAYDMLPPEVYIIEDVLGGRIDDTRLRGVDPVRAHLYELCESRGVAITTMKTLGAGKLVSPQFSPFARPLTVGQCIHYALSRPAVVSALIGCRNRAEVLEAVGYLDLDEGRRDFTDAIGTLTGSLSGKCMYCNHCLPCPAGIDIAAVTRLLDVAALDPASIPTGIRAQYAAQPNRGPDCIACGDCESRCPFGVPVIENMRKAAEILG